jgi:hypothetical protein
MRIHGGRAPGAEPRPGNLVFSAGTAEGDAKPATIRLTPGGAIYVNDRLATTDLEVTDALRAIVLSRAWAVDVELERCEACGAVRRRVLP